MTQVESEPDLPNSIYDIGFYLRASQSHINPRNPNVAKLIKSEQKAATDLIKKTSTGQKLRLKVGETALEAHGPDADALIIQQGEELEITDVKKNDILVQYGADEVQVTVEALARAMLNGSHILLGEDI